MEFRRFLILADFVYVIWQKMYNSLTLEMKALKNGSLLILVAQIVLYLLTRNPLNILPCSSCAWSVFHHQKMNSCYSHSILQVVYLLWPPFYLHYCNNGLVPFVVTIDLLSLIFVYIIVLRYSDAMCLGSASLSCFQWLCEILCLFIISYFKTFVFNIHNVQFIQKEVSTLY